MIKLAFDDKFYPKQLREIENPPKQLYLEGNIELLEKPIIAIVGSRNCSMSGKNLSKKFAKELTKQKITVASGMAKGIDTAAHLGTIEESGKTIAVLGNGFDNIFPKENEALYHNIIKTGGLVISEYPPKTQANSKLFLERNRIVSGISIGIIVIEAGYRSGTSVTARIAKKQGKKVFVLPHEIDNKYGLGTNQLIRKGATLITSTKEIIDEFDYLKYEVIEEKEKFKKSKKKQLKNKEYQEIYNMIENGIRNINEMYKHSNKTINEINNILIMLEIEDYIKKVEGGYICL